MSQRNPQNERYTVERDGRAPGSTRPHAGSAKPASKAGASVRVEKPKMSSRQRAMSQATMSKEEKKAQRAKEREAENLSYSAITTLTNKDERYKKLRRIWWGLLIAAVVFTALSWATLAVNMGTVLSAIVLVLAYAAIIGALVMDFTVIRKRRNFFRDKVAAMSRKQVERIVEDSYVERKAIEEAKKAKKEAKKGGASAQDQQAAYNAAYKRVMGRTTFTMLSDEEAAKAYAKQQEADAKADEAAAASSAEAGAAASSQPTGQEAAKKGLFGRRRKAAEAPAAAEGSVAEGAGAAQDPQAAAAAVADAEAEAARKAAAAKAAREFALSKGRGA